MRKTLLAAAMLACGLSAVHSARAQDASKDAMGMMYEMQIAPQVCGWKDAASASKLDANIAEQEKALGITAADRASLKKKAEADIKSDPTNCTDGMLRSMYDEATK
jgi:hypothetical protein